MTITQQIILKSRPEGRPTEDNFELIECPLKAPQDGEVLCKNLFLSLDPYMRSQIAGRHISGAIPEGGILLGETVAEVIESNNASYTVGDRILIQGGWQTYTVLKPESARPIDPRIAPASLALGVLGMPGLTAYAGIQYLAEAKKGDTLVVSAASGAVGSMVGQFAKTKGCHVIGIAGSKEKCDWLVKEAGFDACINYKENSVADEIDRLCSKGVDIYFDNVGGPILDDIMWRLAVGARVVLCGLMAQINSEDRPAGPNPATIIKARATVRGLVVYDFWDKMPEMVDCFAPLIAANKLKFIEDISVGIDQAPVAFARLMRGENYGKTIIKLG
ncbi:NADP-dependent oxidoreductase [Temperatibacter marinus]|uniref:NADP-dependent oxidoreductase n=1 Tax=Temperatibacter marinus TaxID=1456591 RepID=A0AA52EHY4_9PROT|nr:NADP-dependent oxidoreductase [Temperatibacter marinus]WND03498.1 NADP-dependent oxidoreductase [Temperatibacter marinus]